MILAGLSSRAALFAGLAAVVLAPTVGARMGPPAPTGSGDESATAANSHHVSQAADEAWRIASFLEDAGLVERTVHDLDFSEDGTVWCAASDGLYRYDGYLWERFRPEDPKLSHICRAVLVSGDGTVWVGTDRGALIFEEGRFRAAPEPSGLSGKSIRRISEDPDGTLWFSCDQWPDRTVPGGITRKSGDSWTAFTAETGLPSRYVTEYFRDSRGRRFVSSVGGLAEFDGEGFSSPLQGTGVSNHMPVSGLFEGADGTLTAFTYAMNERGEMGDARLRWTEAGWFVETGGIPGIGAHPVLLKTSDGEVITCTDSAQAQFMRLRGDQLEPVSFPFAGCSDRVRVLAEASDGSIWVGGGNLLVRWQRRGGEWRFYPNLSLPRQRDDAGRVWFAGGTLDELSPVHLLDRGEWSQPHEAARFLRTSLSSSAAYTYPSTLFLTREEGVEEALALADLGLAEADWFVQDAQGGLWVAGRDRGGEFRLVTQEVEGWKERTETEAPPGERTAIGRRAWSHVGAADEPDSALLAYTRPGSLVLAHTDEGSGGDEYLELAQLGMSEVEWVVEGASGLLWVAGRTSEGGFRLVARAEEQWVPHGEGAVPRGTRVQSMQPHADGGVWFVVRQLGSELNSLLHIAPGVSRAVELPLEAASILTPDVLHDDEGRLWVYGFFGVFQSPGGRGGDWAALSTLPGRNVFDGQVRAGEVWFAFNGSTGGFGGLARLRDGSWTHFPAVLGRLVGRDPNGTLIYSSDGGLCVVPPGDGPPAFLSVPTDLRVQGAALSSSGDLWAGLEDGVLRYRPDSVPPETRVELVGDHVNAGDDVLMRVSGIERFLPRDAGVRFRYSLAHEGEEWSPFEVLGKEGIVLSDLPVGTHRLAVRVQDEGRDIDPTPATVQFKVLPVPLQARWWFWPATLGIIAAIAALAAMAFAAKRRLATQAETLTETVRQRTGELQTSETKYRSLFEQSHDAVYVTDVEGVITNANRTTLELVGYEHGEVIGAKPTRLFVYEEDWAKLESDLLTGTPVRDRPCRVRTRDGKTLDTRVTANLRVTEDRRRIGTQVIFRDVTTEVRLQERLRQTQKMEAVGRLAGGVAHDFNNLLTAIRGYGELLALKTAHDEGVSKDVQMVLEAAERAQDLTGQIQTFSRGQIIEPRVIDLNEIVAGMEKLLCRIIGEDVHLDSLLDDELDHVRMDPGQLEQVIVNLAVNARDAMPNGGRLSLETGQIKLDSEGAESADLPGAGTYLLFQVRDTGHGMDATTQEKIFEPFYTTKGRGKGSGLGLATVYGIVRQAGGGITVHSSPGRGTCFRIYLPPCEEEATRKSSVLIPVEVSGGSETILVVEDEDAIRGLIERLLTDVGYHVISAPDAEVGLELARACEEPIDMLLTDLVLPGRKGWELAEILQGERRDLSVLFISGYAEVAEPQGNQGWQPTAPVLKKPFVPSALRIKVREILDRAATDRRRAVSRKTWDGSA